MTGTVDAMAPGGAGAVSTGEDDGTHADASPARPGHEDYVTVSLLAAGLARIRRAWELLQSDSGAFGIAEDDLLPAPWRVAFARVWWACHRAGVAPPGDDLELIQWCRTPFDQWRVRLKLSPSDMSDSLLLGNELSPLAEQAAAVEADDVEAEVIENIVHRELVVTAQANGRGEDERQSNYTYLRRFLIDQPVLSDREHLRLRQRFPKAGGNGQPYVAALLNAAYESRPMAGSKVELCVCSGCRNLLQTLTEPCGTPGCAGAATTNVMSVVGAYFVQHRGVRRFVHDPGLVEARLHDQLLPYNEGDQVHYDPWPGLDAYDGRISFRDPTASEKVAPIEVWGFDAKDQASARLLAMKFTWNSWPPCDLRFLVLPRHRATPAYVNELRTELEGRDDGVIVIDEDAFVRRVASRADQLRRR